LYLNRELSWLAFNERVLDEAADPTVPLLERLRFAAIVASNLDEFFMVRVAGLKRAIDDGDPAPDLAGLTAAQQLPAVRDRSRALLAALHRLTSLELLPALAGRGIALRGVDELQPAEQAALAAFFRDAVLPALTPLAIDRARPFPLLASLTLNLAVRLEPAAADADPSLAIVQVPPGLARLVRVPGAPRTSYVPLEDVIRTHLPALFTGRQVREARCMRLTRNAELDLDEDSGGTRLEIVERELKRRRRSDVVRLEIDAAASSELLDSLAGRLDLGRDDVHRIDGPIDLRLLLGLVDLPGLDDLRHPPIRPVDPVAGGDIFALLDRRDLLLHHPYMSFNPVLTLVAQAAEDPDVLAIKQTLYRVSAGSPLIASLRRAAERNKQVTVILELTARFDEERNIHWARALEEAGAHVIYGVRGCKTHAKMCLVVRRTPRGVRRYLHLGTGNYNERTARMYTDLGLMTSAPVMCTDASAIFNMLTGYADPPRLKTLVMAPAGLRERFLRLIRREQRIAEGGQPAGITAKMNSLIDEEIIEALYAASQAGVRIRLNVRGICALRPGVPGVSDRVEVISIVDRFLEHARIYHFRAGGDDEVYLSSADWMTRNLDRRVEVMWPVEDADARRAALQAMHAMFADTVKARRLDQHGSYHCVHPRDGDLPFRGQQHLQDEAWRAVEAPQAGRGLSPGTRPKR
jgi:polyphosphate kinase